MLVEDVTVMKQGIGMGTLGFWVSIRIPYMVREVPTSQGGFVAQTGKAEEGDQEDFNPFQAATVLPFGGFARHDSAAGALPGSCSYANSHP